MTACELTEIDHSPASPRHVAWRMVAVAAVIQNVSVGLAFGSFGSLILAIEKEFDAGRDISSLTMGLLVVSFAMSNALIGRFLSRLRFRPTMLVGVGLCFIGYLLLSISREMWHILAIYALILGPGSALSGVVMTNGLIARWVPTRTGRALGLVNMTLFVMVVPILCGLGLRYLDLRGVFFCIALVELAVVPVVLAVIEPPAVADTPRVDKSGTGDMSLLKRLDFWIMVLAVGIISGGASVKLAHFVPLLTGQGHSYDDANLLLGISGGAGILGSIAFGLLADRMGPARALVVNAVVQAAAWLILLSPVGFWLLMVDAVAVGACAAGFGSALGVLITRLYGAANFGRAYGAMSLIVLPFLFGFSPIAGVLYQQTGSYSLPVGIQIGGFLLAALLLGTIRVKSE